MDAELSVLTFISYTHNPTTQRMRGEAQTVLVEQHRSTVLWLSNALRHFGVETVLDQYEEDNPPHSWPQWMEKNIKRCCWVLMICSESYHRHVTGQSRVDGGDEGRGSRFEGKTIYGLLTDDQHANKFIPVFLGEKNTSWLPTSLMGSHHYHIRLPEDLQSSPESALEDPEFKKLYARLTGQNRNPAPPVGDVVRLPAQNSTGAPPTGSLQTPTSSQGVTTGRRQLDHPSDEKPGGSHLNGSTVSRPFNPALRGKLAQKDLVKLSKHLGYLWKDVARELGFEQPDIDHFEYGSHHSLKEQAFQMLLAWTRKHGRKASWEALGQALTALGHQDVSYNLDL